MDAMSLFRLLDVVNILPCVKSVFTVLLEEEVVCQVEIGDQLADHLLDQEDQVIEDLTVGLVALCEGVAIWMALESGQWLTSNASQVTQGLMLWRCLLDQEDHSCWEFTDPFQEDSVTTDLCSKSLSMELEMEETGFCCVEIAD